MALRELTMPCLLRRTKAELMGLLKLPHKQEQVLFCNLTPEQYQVYIDFLQTEQVRRAKNASVDRANIGAVFFALTVLRKLCNHPDLLLRDADSELQPPDMWNCERSGKMKVLAEIMKLWHKEGHRALIFVQTVQMLEVLQLWMTRQGYNHLRIDGHTAVKRRLVMIEEFNGNSDIFALLLTTRVGGVGLNIIGADRVVIFDPDWNPMTDVQARERAWRIGQKRDVAVYRLVLTGTVEEKVYQRQVYKHFLTQKVLIDPRQRQFFKWNDLTDLFEVPLPPPNFNAADMASLRNKYGDLFKKLKNYDFGDEHQVETTQVMKEITALPTSDQHVTSKEAHDEHNAILQTLYDSNGIKATFDHDKVEQPLLDRKIVRDGTTAIAHRALMALKESSRECASHHISEPTWTGQRGRAGAASVKREPVLWTAKDVKREMGTVKREAGASAGGGSAVGLGLGSAGIVRQGSVSSADILEGLRQLAAIRATANRRSATQADDAARLRLRPPPLAAAEAEAAAPAELHEADRRVAELILRTFLEPRLAGRECRLTTGQVVQSLGCQVAAHHSDLFKSLLKQMCELSRPSHQGQPGTWTLRPEFRPRKVLHDAGGGGRAAKAESPPTPPKAPPKDPDPVAYMRKRPAAEAPLPARAQGAGCAGLVKTESPPTPPPAAPAASSAAADSGSGSD